MKLSELKKLEENSDNHARAMIEFYDIKNATINNGKVDVNGDVDLRYKDFKKFPVKFGHVTGYFWASNNDLLENFEGAPDRVDGDFECYACSKLISTKGGPSIVKGNYIIYSNFKLESLEGCPEEVGKDFKVGSCPILKSLNHGPKIVGGNYDCDQDVSLTTLDGLPKQINGYLAIRGLFRIKYYLEPIFSVKGVTQTDIGHPEVSKIINKYIKSNDMLNCQDELIEAGLEHFAEIE